MDLKAGVAMFAVERGQILVAYGPFVPAAAPKRDTLAIYRNDFALSDPEPWLHPSRWEWRAATEFAGTAAEVSPVVEWNEPASRSAFEDDFASIQTRIATGALEKAVPLTVERGRALVPTASLAARWVEALARPVVGLHPYFFATGHSVVAGLSPETLIERVQPDRPFTTHALAGTARRGERSAAALLADPKLGGEHAAVVAGLRASLTALGIEACIGTTRVRTLPTLEHLETPIELDTAETSLATLVRALHPTPALGVYPRTDDNLAFLASLKGSVDRRDFGAPIGYQLPDGRARVLVAIRNLRADGSRVSLFAGCGVTAASHVDDEWKELAAKRASVKELLT